MLRITNQMTSKQLKDVIRLFQPYYDAGASLSNIFAAEGRTINRVLGDNTTINKELEVYNASSDSLSLVAGNTVDGEYTEVIAKNGMTSIDELSKGELNNLADILGYKTLSLGYDCDFLALFINKLYNDKSDTINEPSTLLFYLAYNGKSPLLHLLNDGKIGEVTYNKLLNSISPHFRSLLLKAEPFDLGLIPRNSKDTTDFITHDCVYTVEDNKENSIRYGRLFKMYSADGSAGVPDIKPYMIDKGYAVPFLIDRVINSVPLEDVLLFGYTNAIGMVIIADTYGIRGDDILKQINNLPRGSVDGLNIPMQEYNEPLMLEKAVHFLDSVPNTLTEDNGEYTTIRIAKTSVLQTEGSRYDKFDKETNIVDTEVVTEADTEVETASELDTGVYDPAFLSEVGLDADKLTRNSIAKTVDHTDLNLIADIGITPKGSYKAGSDDKAVITEALATDLNNIAVVMLSHLDGLEPALINIRTLWEHMVTESMVQLGLTRAMVRTLVETYVEHGGDIKCPDISVWFLKDVVALPDLWNLGKFTSMEEEVRELLNGADLSFDPLTGEFIPRGLMRPTMINDELIAMLKTSFTEQDGNLIPRTALATDALGGVPHDTTYLTAYKSEGYLSKVNEVTEANLYNTTLLAYSVLDDDVINSTEELALEGMHMLVNGNWESERKIPAELMYEGTSYVKSNNGGVITFKEELKSTTDCKVKLHIPDARLLHAYPISDDNDLVLSIIEDGYTIPKEHAETLSMFVNSNSPVNDIFSFTKLISETEIVSNSVIAELMKSGDYDKDESLLMTLLESGRSSEIRETIKANIQINAPLANEATIESEVDNNGIPNAFYIPNKSAVVFANDELNEFIKDLIGQASDLGFDDAVGYAFNIDGENSITAITDTLDRYEDGLLVIPLTIYSKYGTFTMGTLGVLKYETLSDTWRYRIMIDNISDIIDGIAANKMEFTTTLNEHVGEVIEARHEIEPDIPEVNEAEDITENEEETIEELDNSVPDLNPAPTTHEATEDEVVIKDTAEEVVEDVIETVHKEETEVITPQADETVTQTETETDNKDDDPERHFGDTSSDTVALEEIGDISPSRKGATKKIVRVDNVNTGPTNGPVFITEEDAAIKKDLLRGQAYDEHRAQDEILADTVLDNIAYEPTEDRMAIDPCFVEVPEPQEALRAMLDAFIDESPIDSSGTAFMNILPPAYIHEVTDMNWALLRSDEAIAWLEVELGIPKEAAIIAKEEYLGSPLTHCFYFKDEVLNLIDHDKHLDEYSPEYYPACLAAMTIEDHGTITLPRNEPIIHPSMGAISTNRIKMFDIENRVLLILPPEISDDEEVQKMISDNNRRVINSFTADEIKVLGYEVESNYATLHAILETRVEELN